MIMLRVSKHINALVYLAAAFSIIHNEPNVSKVFCVYFNIVILGGFLVKITLVNLVYTAQMNI